MSDTSTTPPVLSRRTLLGLGAAGAVLAVVSFQMTSSGPSFEGRSLTVTQAHSQAVDGSITLIDIRRPDEWKKTGVGEGAHPIDMRRKDFVTALEAVAGPDRTQPIALICARGVRSARMNKRLTQAGFTQIIDVPEGMVGSAAGPGWLARDLPTVPYKEPQS